VQQRAAASDFRAFEHAKVLKAAKLLRVERQMNPFRVTPAAMPAASEAMATREALNESEARHDAIEDRIAPVPERVRRPRTRSEIEQHNARLEAERAAREAGKPHWTRDDLIQYGRDLAADPEVQRVLAQRSAQKAAERESRRRANEDGVTKFFRGLMKPLVAAGDAIAESGILPGAVDDLYRQFGPKDYH
jgi:hypothetical protein